LIFIPIGILFFSNQQQYTENLLFSNRFNHISLKDLVSDFFALTSNFNFEWGFLRTYFFAMFEGCVFIQVFKKNNKVYVETFTIIILQIMFCTIFPNLGNVLKIGNLNNNYYYLNIFLTSTYNCLLFLGIIFCKYGIFERWSESFKKYNKIETILICLIGIMLCIYMRVIFFDDQFDLLITPLFIIFCIQLIKNLPFIDKPLVFLGKHSTNMWLIHTFYCYYFYPFARLVYMSNNVILQFITLLILSLVSSMLTEKIWKIIKKIYIFLRSEKKIFKICK